MKNLLRLNVLATLFLAVFFSACDSDSDLSGDTKIISFKITNLNPIVEANINTETSTIEFNLPYGTAVDSLEIEVELPENASITPASGSVVNFTNPVIFTVTAEDKTTQDYTATAIIADADFTYDFEDLTLAENAYWNGPDETVSPEIVNLYGTDCSVYYGKFIELNAAFSNTFNDTWQSWSGFAYSNMTDMETAGYGNQYSVYGNSGANNSKNFAVAYAPEYSTPITNITFDTIIKPQSVFVNNSTYAYLSMKNGDSYVTAFTDGDYLKVEAEGFDADGNSTGTLEFYLADYQNGNTKMLSNWEKVDLTALGAVQKIEFKAKASQSGVPTYFCLDDLVANY